MRRILGSFAILSASSTIGSLIGLLRTILLTRGLSKEEFGAIAFAMSLMTLADVANHGGIGQAILQFTSRGVPGSLREAMRMRLAIYPVFAASGLLVLLLPRVREQSWTVASTLSAYLLTYPLLYIVPGVQYYLLGRGKSDAQAAYVLLARLGSFLSAPLALWIFPLPLRVAGVAALDATAQGLVGVYFTWRHADWATAPRVEGRHLEDFRVYGRRMTLTAWVSAFQERLDSLLLGTLVGSAALADFTIGLALRDQVKRVWMAFSNTVYPRYANLRPGEARGTLRGHVVYILLLFGITVVALVAASPWAVPMLFGQGYALGVPYIAPILVGFVAFLPGGLLEVYLRAQGESRRFLKLRQRYLVLTVVSTPLLIAIFGTSGAAFSRLAHGVGFTVLAGVLAWPLLGKQEDDRLAAGSAPPPARAPEASRAASSQGEGSSIPTTESDFEPWF